MVDHAARFAISAARGKGPTDLNVDCAFRAACERFLEIIGEAAAHVSVETQKQMPLIPCYEIIGMRNILAHGYSVIDLDVVWDVITEELPTIIRLIETSIGPVPPQP